MTMHDIYYSYYFVVMSQKGFRLEKFLKSLFKFPTFFQKLPVSSHELRECRILDMGCWRDVDITSRMNLC